MADNTQFTSGPLHVSRLIQLLQRLHLSQSPVSAYNVAEKLGGLIDLTLSVSLANTLGGLQRVSGGSGNEPPPTSLRQKLLSAREHWVADVVANCDLENSAEAMPAPRLKPGFEKDIQEAAQPFARFYALQQSEMEHHISGLQRQVRDVLNNTSSELAQLATLDQALFEIMAKQTRSAFGALPAMVIKHFAWQFDNRTQPEPGENEAHPAWFLLFMQDIRAILLAELDIRLQPVIGLIEACESNIGYTTP